MGKNIILIGFMGCGKTTIGRRVAAQLLMDFYDTDEYIKKCEKMSVYELVKKKGKKYFEGAERFAVINLADKPNAVISTGGGTVISEFNRQKLSENGIIIWLNAGADTIYENTKNSHNKRSELERATKEDIEKILNERICFYEKCDMKINVDNTDIDSVVNEICKRIKEIDL